MCDTSDKRIITSQSELFVITNLIKIHSSNWPLTHTFHSHNMDFRRVFLDGEQRSKVGIGDNQIDILGIFKNRLLVDME